MQNNMQARLLKASFQFLLKKVTGDNQTCKSDYPFVFKISLKTFPHSTITSIFLKDRMFKTTLKLLQVLQVTSFCKTTLQTIQDKVLPNKDHNYNYRQSQPSVSGLTRGLAFLKHSCSQDSTAEHKMWSSNSKALCCLSSSPCSLEKTAYVRLCSPIVSGGKICF